MRPVARIAQSVEQGIENPRVLGSIPSPGTIFRRTRLWRVFRFLGYGLSIELRSIICQVRHALSDSDRGRLQPGNHQWQKGCCAAYQPGLVSGGKHSG